ncbi:O-antigen translocase, partial [Escherichia coli]|nr:O-antigen translocase [Escherichia coli]
MKQLLSVTVFSGLLTLLRMGAGFLVAKIVAVYTGPSGMALLGQLQSIASSLSGVVNAPVSSGIVRYTAQYANEGDELCANWWRASIRWVLVILSFLIPTVCIFSTHLSYFLTGNVEYSYLLIIMVVLLPFTAMGTLLSSIVNGKKRFKKYIIIGMLSVCISTTIMVIFILLGHLKGALIAVSIQNGIIGGVVFLCCFKEKWLKKKYLFGSVRREYMQGIFNYMLMALTTALTLPITLIFVRNILIHYEGWDAAGQWQSVWKISETYLAVITIALGTYYLPKLATLRNGQLLRKEIFSTLKIILPISIIMAVIIFFMRDIIILFLFTEKFKEARELFFIQLCGDVIKIISWLMSYPMLARGDVKWYISSELLFAILFSLLSLFFVRTFGINGANYAYLISYSIYSMFMFLY